MTDKINELKIAYIGGGSRGWAWGLMADLALDDQIGGRVVLYDIDPPAAVSNESIGNRLSAREDVKGRWLYSVAGSLEAALTDADFVIISILPGTFDEMESDVHAPEQYGIYQSVGDTVGPGGVVRALRTIPMFQEIGEAVRTYAPEAWVINYTNPMTICVRTLYEVFPEIKAFGCCHEVFGTQKLLALALKDICGIRDVKREEIQINVNGINHFTWIDEASYRTMDLFPIYRQFCEKYAKDGFSEQSDTNCMNNSFTSEDRVKMDLFLRYGVIAAAGDRHLAEFIPGVYLKDPETVHEWKFALTTVDWRKKDLVKRLEKGRALAAGEQMVELKASGEEGLLLIKALLGICEFISNVNIPNRGQSENLPLGAVVETNAVFRRDSITPMMAGKLPEDVLNLVMVHVINQEGLVKAMVQKDRQKVFNLFMNDPMMKISVAEGRELFEEMIGRTSAYLPAWLKK